MTYEELTRRIDNSYSLFLAALLGKYMSAISPYAEASQSSVSAFVKEAQKISANFLQEADKELKGYLLGLYGDESKIPEPVERLEIEAEVRLRRAVLENNAQLHSLLRMKVNNFTKTLQVSGVTRQLVDKKMNQVEFTVRDTIGRKLEAKRYIHGAIRGFAYQTWITAEVEHLITEGFKLGFVERDKPEENGLIFSLKGKVDNYPSLADIWSKVFHPNSNAKVIGYVQP